MATNLTFDVTALDNASRTLERVADKTERLVERLERLDREDVDVEVNVDTDRAFKNVERFADNSNGVLSGAFRIVAANAYVALAAIIAAMAALPVAAALAAGGIVTAFGGGLAVIGILAAKSNDRVASAFTRLKDHVVETLGDISVPFIDVLITIARVATRTFDAFAPALQKSFMLMAPVLERFVRQFGRAFRELEPTLVPMTRAFNSLLREIGPKLPGIFEDISDALIDMARFVRKHKREIGQLFTGLIRTIPLALRLINKLADLFITLRRDFIKAKNAISRGMRDLRNTVVRNAARIGQGFAPIINMIRDTARSITKFAGAASRAFRATAAAVTRFAGAAVNAFHATVGAVTDFVGTAIKAFNAIRGGLNRVIGWFRSLPGKIVGALAALPGLLYQAGVNAIQGLIDGLTSIDVGSVAAGIAEDIYGNFQKVWSIFSPSKKFLYLGQMALRGLSEGFLDRGERRRLFDAVDRLADATQARLERALDRVQAALAARKSIVSSVMGGFTESIFGATRGSFEVPITKPGGLIAFAKRERGQARHVNRAIHDVLRKGLSKSLVRQLLGQGEVGQAQLFALADDASRKELRRLNRLNAQRLKALRRAGFAAGNELVGDRIERARDTAQRRREQDRNADQLVAKLRRMLRDETWHLRIDNRGRAHLMIRGG